VRKLIVLSIVLALFISTGCTQRPTPYFAPPSVIENVYNHIVPIAVYYYMSEEEWTLRMMLGEDPSAVFMDTDEEHQGKPIKCVAYIGSGTIMKNNNILTVRHLFSHADNTYAKKIWVFHQKSDHAIEADLVAITDKKTDEDHYNDYAVIKMRENLGLPGIPIATKDVRLGEKVMFGCSLGGTAYFMRFGYASKFKWFFKKDDQGKLHLSYWTEYYFTTIHPSGPGDSGSGIFNIKGELVGVAYIGLDIYEQVYCFSNPVGMIWDFLTEHHLDSIGYASSSH
jgi:S1-C subfamily serine protease